MALFALLSACGGASVAPTERQPSESGGGVTDFVLKDVDGKSHALSDYLGDKVIVISFFAMWCEPCKKEMAHLNELYVAHAGEGLMVIGVSMDEPETVGGVRPFVKQRGFTFPVLLDTEARVADQLNPRREAPFNLIIDRNAAIVWSRAGYVKGDEEVLGKAVLDALGKQK
jgi:peroxiredoxin